MFIIIIIIISGVVVVVVVVVDGPSTTVFSADYIAQRSRTTTLRHLHSLPVPDCIKLRPRYSLPMTYVT